MTTIRPPDAKVTLYVAKPDSFRECRLTDLLKALAHAFVADYELALHEIEGVMRDLEKGSALIAYRSAIELAVLVEYLFALKEHRRTIGDVSRRVRGRLGSLKLKRESISDLLESLEKDLLPQMLEGIKAGIGEGWAALREVDHVGIKKNLATGTSFRVGGTYFIRMFVGEGAWRAAFNAFLEKAESQGYVLQRVSRTGNLEAYRIAAPKKYKGFLAVGSMASFKLRGIGRLVVVATYDEDLKDALVA